MIRMQYIRHIQSRHRLSTRLLPVQKVEKVGRLTQISADGRQRLPPTRPMEIGRNHSNLGCQ